jgi:hypothetical protein
VVDPQNLYRRVTGVIEGRAVRLVQRRHQQEEKSMMMMAMRDRANVGLVR